MDVADNEAAGFIPQVIPVYRSECAGGRSVFSPVYFPLVTLLSPAQKITSYFYAHKTIGYVKQLTERQDGYHLRRTG